MARLKVLAIAVATGRVGYVYLVDGVLKDWKLSKKASKSPNLAQKQTKKWISYYQPDVVVTETLDETCRKGNHAKGIIAAIARVAEDHHLLDVTVTRLQNFKNKYEEARALVKRFPDLQSRLPKQPRIWESEPRNTTIFEALVLALRVIDQRRA